MHNYLNKSDRKTSDEGLAVKPSLYTMHIISSKIKIMLSLNIVTVALSM